MKPETKRPTTATPVAQKPANKPAHEIRLSGVRASIWKNDTEKGTFYNTTFERYFRDAETWKSSDSFGRDDLLTLSFVAQEALRWIVQQQEQVAMQTRS